jgi:cytochrome b pre-mRNA-processing protein 3
MFADFDRSLREMGIGDLSVGRHIQRMVEAFYGRIAAYEGGLAGDNATLQAALARNVFGTTPATDDACAAALAVYVRGETARLEREDRSKLLAGDIRFGALSTAAPAEAAWQ